MKIPLSTIIVSTIFQPCASSQACYPRISCLPHTCQRVVEQGCPNLVSHEGELGVRRTQSKTKEDYFARGKSVPRPTGLVATGNVFVSTIAFIVSSPHLSEKSWTISGGDTMVRVGLTGTPSDPQLTTLIKSAVVLVSAIARYISSDRLNAFIERSMIRSFLDKHMGLVRDCIIAEHAEAWSVRQMNPALNERELKRSMYTHAPFWLLNVVHPRVLSTWRLKSIVLQQKVYRDFLRYVGKSTALKLVELKSVEKTLSSIMRLQPQVVRNLILQLPVSFSEWFSFFIDYCIRLGVFRLDLPGHATLRISRDLSEKGHRILECTGRILAWMLATGRREKGVYFQESLYWYLLDKPLGSELLMRDFPQAWKFLKKQSSGNPLMFVVNEDGVDIPLPGAPASLLVDQTNMAQFQSAYIEYHLKPTGLDWIRKGFKDVLPDLFLRGWDAADIRSALSKAVDIKFEDLKAYVKTDGKESFAPFWKAISQWNQAKLRKLLLRWTGSYHVPPGGMKRMRGGYEIRRGDKLSADPETHALFVPNYPTEEDLVAALSRFIDV